RERARSGGVDARLRDGPQGRDRDREPPRQGRPPAARAMGADGRAAGDADGAPHRADAADAPMTARTDRVEVAIMLGAALLSFTVAGTILATGDDSREA